MDDGEHPVGGTSRQLVRVAGRTVSNDGATMTAMSLPTGLRALAPPLATAILFNAALPQADVGLLVQVGIGLGVIALGGSRSKSPRRSH